MLNVITTVGTSLFHNYQKHAADDFNKPLWDYLDKPYSQIDDTGRRSEKEKDKIRKWLSNGNNLNGISAEIQSLKKLHQEKKKPLNIYLITTDTIASWLAAELIEEYFNQTEGITIKKTVRIENLQIKNFRKFELGKDRLIDVIANLIDHLSENIEVKKKRKFIRNSIIFNITGGYKGIIPLMTILAELYGCELFYIFEDSTEMISIARLPINFDPILTEALYVDLWYKKENPGYIPENLTKLIEYGFINKHDKTLTSLGKLFYNMIYTHQAVSQNVFGYFVEYKIYKYLHLRGETGFTHSLEEKGINDKKRELDFVFQRKGGAWEVWEIKSANRFLNANNWEQLSDQFTKQLEIYPHISDYKLIVYSITDKLTPKFEEILRTILKPLILKFTNVTFSAEILILEGLKSIKNQESKTNPYQVMFNDVIKEENFIKIELEENNV